MAELNSEILEQLRDYIGREVRGGFLPVAEIAEAAVEYLADEAPPEDLQRYAEQYTREGLAAFAEEQANWPEVTDCDRLDSAFRALDSAGIIARQDYSCCQNCGHGEIWEEVQATLAKGRSVRGYTFYHQQDTESAVEGCGLNLAYGAAEPGEDALLQVGDEIVAALRATGLAVQWNRDVKKRILVSIDWKRRRE